MLRRIIQALLLVALGMTGIALFVARQPPVVVRHRIVMAGWPAGAPPLRLAMLSDTHMGSLAMPAARLERIVAQTNALRPDCVLLAGDYIEGYPEPPAAGGVPRAAERRVVAPFAALRPRIATIAVAGNHDIAEGTNTTAPMRAALATVGVQALAWQATRCGPLTVAGMDHPRFGNRTMRALTQAAAALGPPYLLLSHSSEHFDRPPVRRFPLMVAGHTHCGQIALPWYGAVLTAGVEKRLSCGLVREPGRALIVGAGLGTSGLPLRLFTRPEILLIEVGGAPFKDS